MEHINGLKIQTMAWMEDFHRLQYAIVKVTKEYPLYEICKGHQSQTIILSVFNRQRIDIFIVREYVMITVRRIRLENNKRCLLRETN